MAGLDLQAARAALAASRIEGMDAPLGEWTEVAAIERRGDTVVISIAVAVPAAGLREALAAEVRRVLAPRAEGATIRVDCKTRVVAAPRRTQSPGLESVRNVIAVASGKGGVGKSTTAVNLALALAHEGARVGLLDADVYGPSQQIMLGIPEHQRPEGRDERFLVPIEAYGLQTMSMGYLVTEKTAMVWRGPMASSALQQMLTQTLWRNLDYLVVDMPPGTGDIQLTLAQKVPVSGAVIVTTPQDIALLDCRKGIEMFTKVDIPVLGVVENMAVHVCSQCGHAEHLFGAGGGERIAREYAVPLLGALPLDIRIREQADGGKPTVAADPDGPLAALYLDCARRMALTLHRRNVSSVRAAPDIQVTND